MDKNTKSRKVKVTFSRGGEFIGTMADDLAPKTCQAIWDLLPIEHEVAQCTNSGSCLWFRLSEEPSFRGMENYEYYGHLPGWMGYDPAIEHVTSKFGTFLLCYDRHFLSMGYKGPLPLNTVFKIEENLEGLKKVGERIWKEGVEIMRIEKME